MSIFGRIVALLYCFSVATDGLDEIVNEPPVFGMPFWLHALLGCMWIIAAVVMIWLGAEELERRL